MNEVGSLGPMDRPWVMVDPKENHLVFFNGKGKAVPQPAIPFDMGIE